MRPKAATHVLLAAGGTGGHVFPALAVARSLRSMDPECRITFVGRREGFERDAFDGGEIRYVTVSARPLPARPGLTTVSALGSTAAATARCEWEILRRRPDVAVGFGGYVSGPALLAARSLGVATAVHEQNAVFGKTNRWLAGSANRVFVTYRDSAAAVPEAPVEWCGMPVRDEAVGREKDPGRFGLEPGRFTVFFLGGSQGSLNLCRRAVDAIGILANRGRRFQAILQTGRANAGEIAGTRFPVPVAAPEFIEDMGAAYAAADVVVARAGASSVAEIAANGLPAVFLPYPYATDDHQTKNVEPLVAAEASLMIPDGELTGETLADTIEFLMADDALRSRMSTAVRAFHREGAAERIAGGILDMTRKHKPRVCAPQKEYRQG